MNQSSLIADVMVYAPMTGQRTGQTLFNLLPTPAANAVRGTTFDPFFKNMNVREVAKWIQEHLIFGKWPGTGKDELIAVFNNDTVVWELVWPTYIDIAESNSSA